MAGSAGIAATRSMRLHGRVVLGLGRGVTGDTSTGLHLNGWQGVAFLVAYGPLLAWVPCWAS
jgi:hypothetical protein